MDTKDEQYHFRCIDLAYNGLGHTAPNPLVGAVIFYKGKIIGEGYHSRFGGAHAEVNAINQIKNESILKNATLLVNLEPCSHFGKTPPCSSLIIEKKIKKVIIGDIDPFPKVSGRGVKMLQQANVEVAIGLRKADSRFINRRFFTFHEKKRPYIILKWAESYDGYLDKIRTSNEPPQWITNTYAKILVHKWRTQEQAILVGTNTVMMDNPQLTARYYYGKNPIRLILDRNNRLERNLNVFDQKAPTVIFSQKNNNQFLDHVQYVQIPFEDMPAEVMDYCFRNNIQSVIIEGGSKVLTSFITRNLWDEARVFKGDKVFEHGIAAPKIDCRPQYTLRLGNAMLAYYFNDEWSSIANIDYI
ncbi:MAG: bifunctional diaminohydroxyphosphoribosylaminopyrimidine deaminase/5-amino-6-(5-phosphoribosylamino)uracil reductase RibD [Bacteroidales bacterium]|nr:bifunctional diaminohydroxyphosphoribosylaminopyrimidine deaminase/5-amino-6-(5-phosphoribosylamino)uracil reductase RibD [Bacteroidales bacterium]